MQWLIDIVLEAVAEVGYALKTWVEAKGYLTTSFVDRGDPVSSDFTILTLTADGLWHDLDLSGIVPAGAKAVLISLLIRSVSTNAYAVFRKKTNVNTWNVCVLSTQVSNLEHGGDFICPLPANRVLNYMFSNVAWDITDFTVKGWWL